MASAVVALICVDVKKTKRVKSVNIYTDKPEMVDVWKVEVTSPFLPGQYIDLSFENQKSAERFSKGKSYTFTELIALFTNL